MIGTIKKRLPDVRESFALSIFRSDDLFDEPPDFFP